MLCGIDYPKTLKVYVNNEELKDSTNATKPNMIANYNEQEQYYEISMPKFVGNCNKFEIEPGKRYTEAFKFKYQGKEYAIHYRDKKIRGNKLPSVLSVEELEKTFHIKVEYDYANQKINFIL